MRVLVLFGSPKRDRPTGELLDAFLKQLPVQAHVEEYHCFSSPLVPCDGCGACDVQGQCRHRDGDVLWDQLEQADVLIVATPIYFMSYPAPMKAVVDRLQRYWSIRFVLGKKPTIQRPKKGFLLTTSGSEGDQADVVRRQTRMFFSILNTHFCGEVDWTHTDNGRWDDALESRIKEAISCLQE